LTSSVNRRPLRQALGRALRSWSGRLLGTPEASVPEAPRPPPEPAAPSADPAGPPAHWLEKVRRGAPELLDPAPDPPAHWLEKVRRGAPELLQPARGTAPRPWPPAPEDTSGPGGEAGAPAAPTVSRTVTAADTPASQPGSGPAPQRDTAAAALLPSSEPSGASPAARPGDRRAPSVAAPADAPETHLPSQTQPGRSVEAHPPRTQPVRPTPLEVGADPTSPAAPSQPDRRPAPMPSPRSEPSSPRSAPVIQGRQGGQGGHASQDGRDRDAVHAAPRPAPERPAPGPVSTAPSAGSTPSTPSAVWERPTRAEPSRPIDWPPPPREHWPSLPAIEPAPSLPGDRDRIAPVTQRWPELPSRVGEAPEEASELGALIQELAHQGRLDREQRGS
jgi:hypothetical protein